MTATDIPGLSRRRLLAALGVAGVSVAGAGLGTTSHLSDAERFPATVAAGRLDLGVGYRSTYNGETTDAAPGGDDVGCETPGLVDGDAVPAVELADVKPGDCGTVSASLHVCANPARLWLAVALGETAENDRRPEERLAGDVSDDAGELQDLIEVVCWLDADGDGTPGPDERVLYEGTLAGLATATGDGVLLTADEAGAATCADTGTAVAVGLAWCLPLDGPDHNRAITDTVAFDLCFGAVQCRHDPSASNPFAAPGDPPDARTDGDDPVRAIDPDE